MSAYDAALSFFFILVSTSVVVTGLLYFDILRSWRKIKQIELPVTLARMEDEILVLKRRTVDVLIWLAAVDTCAGGLLFNTLFMK